MGAGPHSRAPSTSRAGYLESRIENVVPDASKRVILYCATGQRSALAANTLEELLGYEDVASMNGGFVALEGPRLPVRPAADPDRRAEGALLAPPARPGGRHRGPAEAARREGAADRRGRARLAGGAVPGGGRRRHARHRRRRRGRPHQPPAPGDPQHRSGSASRRSSRPRKTIEALNPDVEVMPLPDAPRPGQRARPDRATTT